MTASSFRIPSAPFLLQMDKFLFDAVASFAKFCTVICCLSGLMQGGGGGVEFLWFCGAVGAVT